MTKAHKGFTLVEVLVALSIMSIIAVMAWQGVDGMVRTRSVITTRLEKLLRINTVLAQWEQDLNALQDPKLQGLPNGLEPLTFNGASVTLTRRAPGGLQLVVWSLRSGAWQRWASPAVTTQTALLEHFAASQQFLGNEQGQLTTLTDITEWQIYFFRDNAWSNAQSSAGLAAGTASANLVSGNVAAPVRAAAPLPQGVRLVLTMGGTQGAAGKVTRDIPLGPQ
jgi:general secretion pathway protein J